MEKAKSDLISVIIPNYNNEQYLSRCLDSIIGQTYPNLEIIIIDDCSTDGSVKIIDRYAQIDNRIHCKKNRCNCGVARSRDKGIEESSGVWITTLDSDDIFLSKEKVEKEYELACGHRHSGQEPIIFSGIQFISATDELLGRQPGRVAEGDLLRCLLERSCMIPRDFLFTKKQYFEVGGYDPAIPIYEDWDLKIRLAARYSFYFSKIDGIGYRRHGSGLSAAPQKDHIKWLHKVFLKNIKLAKRDRAKIIYTFYRLVYRMIRNSWEK